MTKQIVEKDKADIYSIKEYPKRLRPIIEILMEFETSLTDGFEWYADREKITELALRIYKLSAKKKESQY